MPCITIIASYTDQESAPVADDTDAEIKALLALKFLDWHTLPETFDSAPAGLLHEVHQQLRAETARNWELRASRHKAETQTVAGVNFFSQRRLAGVSINVAKFEKTSSGRVL